jgi:UDP-galactopyranose mutase
MAVDYLIVGSGLAGAVIARELFDNGHNVLVMERRSQVGGNVCDHDHISGIKIHTYGPHYFRTNDENLWQYVNKFSSFYKYEPRLKSFVDGAYENWPVTDSYIKQFIGPNWKPPFTGLPVNFEEASLAMMPEAIYVKFVKGYTEKQWGVDARKLSHELAKRFDVSMEDAPRLFKHKYQGIPEEGYSFFMYKLLEGIPVLLNFDYLKSRDYIKPEHGLVFTGPIDEYFGYKFGRLTYRGQIRLNTYIPDVEYIQPCGQVNNPDTKNGEHIRTLEWKHMMKPQHAGRIAGTVLTTETPFTPESPDNYEYPFPDADNEALYAKYRREADMLGNVIICGRLGEYKYYDMDQAISRAMVIAEKLLSARS